MADLTAISNSTRIMTKSKASMEGIQQKKEIATSIEIKELKQFEMEMQKALVLSQEIRHSLETALRDLA